MKQLSLRKYLIVGVSPLILLALYCRGCWGLSYYKSSTYGPNGGENVGNALTVDQQGNVFVAGYLYLGTKFGFSVVKFNDQLNFISSCTFEAGSAFNYAHAVALNAAGDIFATGFIKPIAGSNNIFVVKLKNDLVSISSVTISPPIGGQGQGTGVSVSPDGNAYVAGYLLTSGIKTGWIGQFDQNLVLLSTAIVAPVGRPDILFKGGNVYVTGSTLGGNLWLGKYNPSLTLISSITIPTVNLPDSANGTMGMDPNGNIVVAGSENNHAWLGKFDSSLVFISSKSESSVPIFETLTILPDGSIVAGEDDLSKVFKFDSTLSLISSLSDSSFGNVRGICSDLSGNVYVSGYKSSLLWLSKHPALVAPSSFSGIALSSSSIRWSWTDVVGELAYQVLSNTGEDLSGILPANTLSWEENGLQSNASYSRHVVSREGLESHASISSVIVTLDSTSTTTVSGIPIAYPNPLRPALAGQDKMTLDGLPAGAQISIFNLKGDLILKLPKVDSSKVIWDLRNTQGESVSSGVYFVRIEGTGVDKILKVAVQR